MPTAPAHDARFPILGTCIHLDHAAVAPLPQPVVDAMRRYLDDWSKRGPTAWAYQRIAALRGLAARLVGAGGAEEIAIMPNTSTGLATIAAGLHRGAGLGRGDVVVTTAVEFPANRYVWEDRVRRGLDLRVVEADAGEGRRLVRDEAIVEAMREAFAGVTGTKVLAISHVQFATGQRHDLALLAAEAKSLGALVCVDAIQSLGQIPFAATEWGIDFASADGHKWMLGPEGAGILYVSRERFDLLHPPIMGWLNTLHPHDHSHYDFTLHGEARRFEPGAFSIGGVVGLAAALELLLEEGLESIELRVLDRAATIADAARRAGLKIVSTHDAGLRHGSGIVAIDAGSPAACEALHAKLLACGIHGAVRRGLLRLSPHFYNTAEQMERVGEALRGIAVAS